MRILFDTNIIIDVVCKREPWAAQSIELLSLADKGDIEGILCATTITTMHYLLSSKLGREIAQREIKRFLNVFTIAAVDHRVLSAAESSGFSDFEDAVLYVAACRSGADAILTRNTKDFKHAKLPVYDPHELHVIKFGV